MISVIDLSLSFQGQKLFDDVNLSFTPGNCYGVIGANGAGKSTFLKILEGRLEPDTGSVSIKPNTRISFLEQDHFKFEDEKVIDVVIMGNARLMEIIREKEAIYAKEDFSDEDGILASELDVFEGQSQTRLAKSISDYILNADKESIEDVNQASIPRIIGIEGSWGAGKSNVVAKVEEQLKAQSYYTFTYDSWGHQEDLQRRSILETLTNRLIEDKVLRGEVSIKMRNGRLHTAKWSDQLQMLLSNKTTTIIKSVPKFSWGAVLGILLVGYFVGSSVVFNQLIDKGICFGFRWILIIELLPLLLVGCILLLYALCKNKWEVFTTFLTQKDDSTIDEQFTSSEEPSITEFQNWMHAISNELEKKNSNTNKIIIVFDNMDRLPSNKVVQLWSLIYTFFAGRDFENIWVIIPFSPPSKRMDGKEEGGHVRDEEHPRVYALMFVR